LNSEKSAPQLRTMLYISGDSINFADLEQLIQKQPTETGVKNEVRPNKKLVHAESFWKYSEETNHYSVDDAVSALLNILGGAVSQTLGNYLAEHMLDLSIICNVTIYDDRPVYELSRKTIKELANLDAEFIMDIFDYSD